MSKGLEASKEFRLLVANYEDKWSKNTTEHFIKCADIIEKELEHKEKSEKALEIIKNKQVNFYWLSISSCVGDYNIEVKEYFYKSNFEEFLLTKEEYDLLREVLL